MTLPWQLQNGRIIITQQLFLHNVIKMKNFKMDEERTNFNLNKKNETTGLI